MPVAKHGVSADSADRLLVDAGAVYLNFYDVDYPGTLLGATRGGNTFELTRTIRRIEADGMRGPVKGFRRIEEVLAKLTVNLLEMTAENVRRALVGATYISGTTQVTDEAVGTGDGVTKDFTLAQKPIWENTVTIAVVDRPAQVELADYVLDKRSGALHFIVAPENLKAITATYKYVSASAVIAASEPVMGIMPATAFLDNVVLVGTISGKTNPVIVKLQNVICDQAFSLGMAPKDEAVLALSFSAHYTNTDLASEPWTVEYPAS